MEERFERYHPDIEAMHRGFRTKPCFVCEMVNGNIRFPENVIREDEQTLVFLDTYPRAYGYTLVAPKEHREQVTADFALEEYLELQKLLYLWPSNPMPRTWSQATPTPLRTSSYATG